MRSLFLVRGGCRRRRGHAGRATAENPRQRTGTTRTGMPGAGASTMRPWSIAMARWRGRGGVVGVVGVEQQGPQDPPAPRPRRGRAGGAIAIATARRCSSAPTTGRRAARPARSARSSRRRRGLRRPSGRACPAGRARTRSPFAIEGVRDAPAPDMQGLTDPPTCGSTWLLRSGPRKRVDSRLVHRDDSDRLAFSHAIRAGGAKPRTVQASRSPKRWNRWTLWSVSPRLDGSARSDVG